MWNNQFIFKGELRPKRQSLFLWQIFLNFMENEPCTTFRGVLISFNEVMKLQSLNFTQVTSYPRIHRTFHPWLSFHVFVNFMKNEFSKKLYCVYDHFTGTYRDAKFWIIKLWLDVSDAISVNEHRSMLIVAYM